jgi:hypothetical protein
MKSICQLIGIFFLGIYALGKTIFFGVIGICGTIVISVFVVIFRLISYPFSAYREYKRTKTTPYIFSPH